MRNVDLQDGEIIEEIFTKKERKIIRFYYLFFK